MQKHLFLTGKAGCGKSLAIREVLGPKLQTAGGFVAETMRDPGGAALCRSLLPAAAAGGRRWVWAPGAGRPPPPHPRWAPPQKTKGPDPY